MNTVRNGFILLYFIWLLVMAAFLTDAGIRAFYDSQPRLVGHGCVGTNGPVYANEEDEFPPCEIIEERL